MFKVTILILFSISIIISDSEEIKVIVERNVPVPMRDGTVLRADVYRPDRGGPYPVLVRRTPYGKERNLVTINRFVKAGYIVVSQDTRGRYESEGRFESLWRSKTHDAEDGYDTIMWAAKLSGATGKVGTFGGSYEGFLQWRLAPLPPSSLACMSATNFGIVRLLDGEGTSGMRPGIRPQWLAMMAADMQRRENLPSVHTIWEAQKLWQKDSVKWINWLPWLELPDDFFGYETDTLKQWLKNPHVDPWRLDEGVKEITVPNLEITGWYDHALGDMVLFQTMVKEAKTEVARRGSRIIVGPWSHSLPARSFGNIDFGPDALLDMTALQIRWFDHWLKGSENGVEKDPPLKIFVMGDNTWRDEQHWPLQRTDEKVLYITSDDHANTPNGDGRLVAVKPQSNGIDNYMYDPQSPVPTPYGAARPRAADQRVLAEREDILVFQTEPLTERLEVTGNPVVELYASSSAPDTDWFVRLIDVHSNGLARDVSMGMIRARYRYGQAKPEMLKPGKTFKYSIRMRPTSNAFLPGHRIRVDITSSDFPWYDRNHNTSSDQNADVNLVIANQTVHHGGEQATRIILPWIPNPVVEGPTAETKSESVPQKQMHPLHTAAADGDATQIRLLLAKEADVNAKDEEGKTLLHYAVKSGQMEVVQILVEAGVDIHSVDKDGVTSLHTAAKFGKKDVVDILVANGADINTKDKWFWSPLHYAAWYGHKDVVELLISKGADTRANDIDGVTPLDHALSMQQKDVAAMLLAEITDFAWKDKRGLTALQTAAVEGYRDSTEVLLSKGVKVDEKDDNYEFTALHYAARFGSTKVAEVLIAHGADIRAKDKWDYEPIHWAAYHDRPEIIELLIAKGADVNVKTSLGQTPLELAKPRRNTSAIKVLRKHGAKEDNKLSSTPE